MHQKPEEEEEEEAQLESRPKEGNCIMPPPPPKKKKKKKRSREYVFLSTLPFPPFFEGKVSDDYFPNIDDSVIKGPYRGTF